MTKLKLTLKSNKTGKLRRNPLIIKTSFTLEEYQALGKKEIDENANLMSVSPWDLDLENLKWSVERIEEIKED